MKNRLRFAVVSALAAWGMTVATLAIAVCTGDCDGSACEVTVDEIISMVNIALGTASVSSCTAGDVDGNGEITINEIIASVGHALNDDCDCQPNGCGDGITTGTEECDNGGVCIGGSSAGIACTTEATCQGNGVCTLG
jgi:hypothetical protein